MRHARHKKPGAVYYIGNYTANKEARFTDGLFFEMIQDVIQTTKQRFDIEILAESLTERTVQWVISTPRSEDISEVMKYLKQRITQRHNRMTGRSGPLWDDRYKSRLLETSDGIEEAINFVHGEKDIRHIPDFDKEACEEREHKRMSRFGYEDENKTATTEDTNDSLLTLETPSDSDEDALRQPNSLIFYRMVSRDKTLSSYFCTHYPGSYIFLYDRVGFRAYKAKQGIQLE